MENNETSFSYTYSAAQQQEVESIRKKYLPPEEDRMERLRALHRSASHRAQVWAITLGILGALLLGAGMSLTMSDLGTILGLSGQLSMVIGIIVGLAGLVLAAMAYPVYNHVLKKTRQRIAPEILRLTEELLK